MASNGLTGRSSGFSFSSVSSSMCLPSWSEAEVSKIGKKGLCQLSGLDAMCLDMRLDELNSRSCAESDNMIGRNGGGFSDTL